MQDRTINKPKHRQVYEYVFQAISEGRFEAGKRLPTDAQLMRRFDTSRPTVARAMRDLEQAGYVERRPGSGSYVRLAASSSSNKVGLLISGLGETEIFEPICGQLARACQKHNFSLIWGDQSEKGQEQPAEALCRWYIDQGVAGVFFAPMELMPGMAEMNRHVAAALDKAGVIVILLDRDVTQFPLRSNLDLVGIDNFRAGYKQAEHMIQLGCQRLHYICRPMSAATGEARIAGYQYALKRHGIAPSENWVHRVGAKEVAEVQAITAQRPDAILCSNDFTAANLMRNLVRLDVRVPQDVRVIGLDDVKYAQLLSVPLTTLRQPCREIGDAAVTAMVRRLENRALPPRDILLDTKLVVRESCGASQQAPAEPEQAAVEAEQAAAEIAANE